MTVDFSDDESRWNYTKGVIFNTSLRKIVCLVNFFDFWWYLRSYQVFILFPIYTQYFGFIQFLAELLFCECLINLIYQFFSLQFWDIWILLMNFIAFGPSKTLACHDLLSWFVSEEMLVEDQKI